MSDEKAKDESVQEIDRFLARYGKSLRTALTRLRDGLSKETDETREMLDIYYRYTNGKASDEELSRANAQFKDVLRAMGLSVFLILPAAPITIPFFVKLGQMLGIDLLPSSFRDDEKPSE